MVKEGVLTKPTSEATEDKVPPAWYAGLVYANKTKQKQKKQVEQKQGFHGCCCGCLCTLTRAAIARRSQGGRWEGRGGGGRREKNRSCSQHTKKKLGKKNNIIRRSIFCPFITSSITALARVTSPPLVRPTPRCHASAASEESPPFGLWCQWCRRWCRLGPGRGFVGLVPLHLLIFPLFMYKSIPLF